MKCATCRGLVARDQPRPAWYPFCSQRCQLIDLGKWLGEEYKVSEPAGTADQSPSQGEEN